jgi:hypothetical protein
VDPVPDPLPEGNTPSGNQDIDGCTLKCILKSTGKGKWIHLAYITNWSLVNAAMSFWARGSITCEVFLDYPSNY